MLPSCGHPPPPCACGSTSSVTRNVPSRSIHHPLAFFRRNPSLLLKSRFLFPESLSQYEHGTIVSISCFRNMSTQISSQLSGILHKCRSDRSLENAQLLYAHIRINNLAEINPSLSRYTLSLLVDVGDMHRGHELLDNLGHRDECLWNILITGYVKQGKPQRAISLYHEMCKDARLYPSSYTFVALLKASCMLKDLKKGCELHAEISRRGFLKDNTFVSAAIVDLYVKCGSFIKAEEVLVRLQDRNVVMWTSLIAGYGEYGRGEEALRCFERMQQDGIQLDEVTIVCVLKACMHIRSVSRLQEIHTRILIHGLERNLIVGGTLIDAFAKCGSLVDAQAVFERVPVRDMVIWTALITGYAECGHGEKAFDILKQMQEEGIAPGLVTFLSGLKACMSTESIEKGHEIHNVIIKTGSDCEVFIGSSLVDMYAKWSMLEEAQTVFDNIRSRNIVSWTALIQGYVEHGQNRRALECFEKLKKEDIFPNAITFVAILKACGNVGEIEKGQEIHAEVERNGFLGDDVFIGSILVDMYAKCGFLEKAQEIFLKISNKNVVSWTALIAGFAEHGYGEDAISYFEKMQDTAIGPSSASYVCALKACGSIGAILKGYVMHHEITSKALDNELLVGNAVVDMYIKCGLLPEAADAFDKLPIRDVITWTALITGYAQRGESENVFHIFDKMIEHGVKPNLVTFGSVLNACSHAGLTDKGQTYLDNIGKNYGLIPTLEHYTCMVDLLGRAGHIDRAVALIKKMPFHPSISIWHVVLGACHTWGNVELGRCAFEHAIRVDEKDPAAYICMSNIYIKSAMQEDARKVEALRIARCAWIKPGQSWWKDAQGILYLFPDPHRGASQNKILCALRSDEASAGNARNLTHPQGTEGMASGGSEQCSHSEKVAIAYALINTTKGMPIYIVKFPRVCNDCHLAIAHISKMENRRIVLKDVVGTHVFDRGICECASELHANFSS